MLKKIIRDIDKLSEIANQDISDIPNSAMTTRIGIITRAKMQIEALRQQFKAETAKSTLFIAVVGEKSDEFATVASDYFGCHNFDFNDIFDRLSSTMPSATVFGKLPNVNMFEFLEIEMEKLAQEIGLVSYNRPSMIKGYRSPINTKLELLDYVKQVVVSAVGFEFLSTCAIAKTADLNLENENATKFNPIVVKFSDTNDLQAFTKDVSRYNPIFVVSCGKTSKELKALSTINVKDANEKEVEAALKAIRDSL